MCQKEQYGSRFGKSLLANNNKNIISKSQCNIYYASIRDIKIQGLMKSLFKYDHMNISVLLLEETTGNCKINILSMIKVPRSRKVHICTEDS